MLHDAERGDSSTALTRRGFLQAGIAVGGSLLVGFHVPSGHAAQAEKIQFAPNLLSGSMLVVASRSSCRRSRWGKAFIRLSR
jgi:hypothetical protein